MKAFLILFFLSISAFSQNKKFYLEIDDSLTITNKNEAIGAYEFRLAIQHHNTKTDTDYYNFLVNVPEGKTFETGGVEISEPVFLTSEEIRKLFSCDVHDLLSQAPEIYLIKKKQDKKYEAWIATYFGTVRNLVVTRAPKKM
jgi:outer membrane protein assembly factor BamA